MSWPPILAKPFARVLGPFYAILPVIAAVRAPNAQTLLSLSDFGAWPWATGVFAFILGIFIVAFHQYRGSVAAVIVSLLGRLMALRGFVLLAFPSAVASIADSVIGASALWRTFYIWLAAIGLCLTYVGWAPARNQPD